MRAFTDLFRDLDQTTSTNEKVAALVRYFERTPPEDAAWAVFLLTGRTIRRPINTTRIRVLVAEMTGLPLWLIEESYNTVGDLAETVALLVGRTDAVQPEQNIPLHSVLAELETLLGAGDATQVAVVGRWWERLSEREIFIFTKLLTGSFRVGVSATLVKRALATVAKTAPATIAHRLMGHWEPTASWYQQLLSTQEGDADRSRPYPFFLATQLSEDPESLGSAADWQAEWKWDGIRAQLLRRRGGVWIWSRGEELVTDRYPEVMEAAKLLPDGLVLDGELLVWGDDKPLPFAALQRRIGRKIVSRKMLAEFPVVFLAYDLLEADGVDLRNAPLDARRRRLERVIEGAATRALRISPLIGGDWIERSAARNRARERRVEGLMLKRRSSGYGVGRRIGDWWKWKIEPHTLDAVLIYAQSGHGKRATLQTDYTFGVWHEGKLVPIAKAYSGLDDEEIKRLDRWIRTHTLERFGPVRSVEQVHVFELAFESIARSTRHKSGIAVRFPRILRWRDDKTPADADTLERLTHMIDPASPSPPFVDDV